MPSIHNIIRMTGKFLTDNSPTILTALAITGSVSSTVLAIKATPKALENIREAEEKKFDENPAGPTRLTVWETMKATYVCYIPSVALTVLTVGCIVSAHSINTRRNAALLGAYTLTETALREYQEKVTQTVGETKAEKIRTDMIQDRINRNPPSGDMLIVENDTLVQCYDVVADRYFWSDMESIRRAMNTINHQVNVDMWATQTEFFLELGLPKNGYSDDFGWDVTRLLEITFGGHINPKTSKPCLSIDYRMKPVKEFSNHG